MKRRIGIGVALLGGAVAVAIGFTGSSKSPSNLTTGHVPTAALSSSSASALRPVLELGVEHRYQAHLAQTVTLDAENRVPFVVSLDGTWAVTYAGGREGTELFRAQLRDAKPMVKRGDVDVSAALGDTLHQPFYFTTTSEGRLISLSFAPGVDEVARGALAALAATFQVSARGITPAWETVESDTIGDYQARYARSGAGVRRERVAYSRVTGGGAVRASVVTTGTDVKLRGEDGWPADVSGHEATRVGTDQLAVVVDATFSLKFVGVQRGVDAGAPTGLVTMAVDATSAVRTTEAEDRDLVDGASLADLLAGLAAITDQHARGYQYLRIAALMRLEPDAVRAAQRMVLDGSVTGDTASLVIGAMSEAGTPVAQHALGELLTTATLGEDARTHAAISMGLTGAPTPETMQTLADTARGSGDLANTATLAQGNASLRMRDDDPSTAASQVDALIARLARATDDNERALVLRALGNTGDPRILESIARALTSDTIGVRIAATEALRLVPGSAADQLLLGRFRDASGLVRGAAVFATVERDLAPFAAALARTVRTDPDVTVRRAIVDLAAARLDEPTLRALVEQVAKADADPDLRQAAKAVLAG